MKSKIPGKAFLKSESSSFYIFHIFFMDWLLRISRTFFDQNLSDLSNWPISLGPLTTISRTFDHYLSDLSNWPKSLGPFKLTNISRSLTKISRTKKGPRDPVQPLKFHKHRPEIYITGLRFARPNYPHPRLPTKEWWPMWHNVTKLSALIGESETLTNQSIKLWSFHKITKLGNVYDGTDF